MLKKFISYYKPHKTLFIFDMIASFLISAIAIAYPIVTRKIFNEYIYGSSQKPIIICGIILFVLYVVRMILKYFVQSYGHVMGVKMQATMRKEMFEHLQSLPYSYYDEHETGRIMARMTSDLQDVSELAHHGPENVFICGVSIIGSFAYLCTINWVLSLIIFACVPIMVTITLLTRTRMNKAFAENKKNMGYINAALESSISGIRVTKAFTNEEKELEKFQKSNKAYVKSRSKAYKAMGLFGSTTGFVTDLFNVVCIVGGGLLVYYTNIGGISNVISVPDYLAFVTSISLFISPLNTLIQFVEQYQDGKAGFTRFLEILDVKSEEEKEDAIKDIKLEGNIEFKNVSFNYETSQQVLNNVSFNIKKGETIALVGESGGGKTTICHLIPNFYKVSEGSVNIDGYNINDLSFKTLRDSIGIVQQDVFLFNGTIKDNILYGKLNATDEEVIEASKRANIYQFIMDLPNGFDTEIGERGVKLSGGQKQRLSIARVFLKNPSILILDEATSALDNTTEILIQDALNELAKGRTTIIVAHRLSTIKNANRIFVVNKGEIVEEGSHDELIAQGGIYKELYNLQFRVSQLLG